MQAGAPADVIAQFRAALAARNANATFAVWPQNWHAVMLFCDMASQWRVVARMAGLMYQGLEYSALPLVMRARKPLVARCHRQRLHELMPQLRTLERTAAKFLNGNK